MPKTPYQQDKEEERRKAVKPPMFPLAQVRKSHGWTQAQLAEKVHAITDEPFSPGSLSLIEKGHRGASASVLAALGQAFGMDPDAAEVDYTPSHSRRKIEGLTA